MDTVLHAYRTKSNTTCMEQDKKTTYNTPEQESGVAILGINIVHLVCGIHLKSNFRTILNRSTLDRSLCQKFISHFDDWSGKYVSFFFTLFYSIIILTL